MSTEGDGRPANTAIFSKHTIVHNYGGESEQSTTFILDTQGVNTCSTTTTNLEADEEHPGCNQTIHVKNVNRVIRTVSRHVIHIIITVNVTRNHGKVSFGIGLIQRGFGTVEAANDGKRFRDRNRSRCRSGAEKPSATQIWLLGAAASIAACRLV